MGQVLLSFLAHVVSLPHPPSRSAYINPRVRLPSLSLNMDSTPALPYRATNKSDRIIDKENKGIDEIQIASRPGSLIDEKPAYIQSKGDNTSEIGEVFAEGPRLIDLGTDGKERPIGKPQNERRNGH